MLQFLFSLLMTERPHRTPRAHCFQVFRKISYDNESDTSVLECTPVHGRTHQIRLHLQVSAARFCPRVLAFPSLGIDMFTFSMSRLRLKPAERCRSHDWKILGGICCILITVGWTSHSQRPMLRWRTTLRRPRRKAEIGREPISRQMEGHQTRQRSCSGHRHDRRRTRGRTFPPGYFY